MSDEQSLRLVKPESESDSIPFERRTLPRRSVSGQVTALCTRPRDKERPNKICSLKLIDLSDLGLGALSQDRLEVGNRITVFLPPHGAEAGTDLYGEIVRCNETEGMFDVGIRLHSNIMAA